MSPHAHRDVIGRQARLNGRPPHFRSHSHFCSKQRTTPPSPDQLTSPASPIPTARTSEASYGAQTELSSQPTASVRRSLPNRRQRPRGPASPPHPEPGPARQGRASSPSGFHLAAILPPGPRPQDSRRPRGPRKPNVRAAGSLSPPLASRPRRVWQLSPYQRWWRQSSQKRRNSGTRSINGTSCGPPGVSLYSHRKPRPSPDPSAEMRSGTTF